MTTIRRFAMVLALSVIVGGVVPETKADDTKEVEGNFAGTFLDTRIDNNSDSVPASWFTVEVENDFGKSTIQGVVERVPDGPTSECPGGVFIMDALNSIGSGASTQTFRNGEDQLYAVYLTSTLCADAVGGFAGEETGVIVGGAGKFAGVDGTFESSFSGHVLAFSPTAVPPQGFGFVTGHSKSELNIPDGDDDDDNDDD